MMPLTFHRRLGHYAERTSKVVAVIETNWWLDIRKVRAGYYSNAFTSLNIAQCPNRE
jgi:hypothetical protein